MSEMPEAPVPTGDSGIDIMTCLTAAGAAVAFALASELIGWFLIYRHDDYKKTLSEVVEL